jgi:hypothetical protein
MSRPRSAGERSTGVLVSSGIVLPGDKPLTLREIAGGLYVAVNAYECDAGYFGQSPLYPKEQPESQSETVMRQTKGAAYELNEVAARESQSETVMPPANSAVR